MSPQQRGRGRVVARTQKQSLVVAGEQQQQQQANNLLLLPSTSAQQPTTPPAPQQRAIVAPAATPDTSTPSDWRCAAFVAANSKPVQELSASAAASASASARRLLQGGQPVLIKQLQLSLCRLNTSTNSSSSSSTPTQQQPLQLPVLCSPADTNRFMSADAAKNLPGSYYHVRKPETSSVLLTFAEWSRCWQTWSHTRLLLQAHVCNWELYTNNTAGGEATPATTTSLRVWPNKAVHPHLTQLLQIGNTVTASPPTTSTAAQQQQEPTAAAPSNNAATTSHAVLDWPLLQQLLHAGLWAPTGSLHLVAGGNDALLPARYETHDRLLTQVSGRQRVLLLPPGQAFRGLYPYPVHSPYDQYSAVDWEEPELEHWPAAEQVCGLVCDLSPGDTLYIPGYWFVHSQLMQPACVGLELCLLSPQQQQQQLSGSIATASAAAVRLSSPSALLLQLSRMIELWFGAEAGPANVRRWLLALSEGREWTLLQQQLMTVKGYKLLQCCAMTLQQLQSVLTLLQPNGSSSSTGSSSSGQSLHASTPVTAAAAVAALGLEGAARQLLGFMCEGRLVPTTWLNEGIRDPLYLQHPPQYHLIEEDGEAARYSALFRHRLIGNRPDWMQHATPLLRAPPGSKRSLIKAADAAERLLMQTGGGCGSGGAAVVVEGSEAAKLAQ